MSRKIPSPQEQFKESLAVLIVTLVLSMIAIGSITYVAAGKIISGIEKIPPMIHGDQND